MTAGTRHRGARRASGRAVSLLVAIALLGCSSLGGSDIPSDVQGEMDGLERALALHPGDAVALRRLADLDYDFGKDEAADRHYRALIETTNLDPEALGDIAERFRKMGERFAWDVSRPSEEVNEAKSQAYREYARLLEARAKFLAEGAASNPWIAARIEPRAGRTGAPATLGRVMLACTNRQYESGPPGMKRLAWTYYGDVLALLDPGRRRASDSSSFSIAEIAGLRLKPRAGEPALIEVALREGVERGGRCEVCIPRDECSIVGDREQGGLEVVPILSIGSARFGE